MDNNQDPVSIPIDGILDLHTFHPKDIKEVVTVYIEECKKNNIHTVYFIHGKGKGVQRRVVQGVLKKEPAVQSFHTAPEQFGGWGATVAYLQKRE